ncbi:dienelactone hydrolase family protein [Embleya scabrispora]|uniref:dienelactone hydrolase family protein n=1 Tax=Embleya scabrispora TaxID=159449 RepID=UPI000363C7A1|nr:dienelactone hydrolase family protein [Embleya scabrispora]
MVETVDLSAMLLRDETGRGLTGHLARPKGKGPWPGVVVLFEGAGPDAVNRRHADRMAEAGYLALMPDLYHGRGPSRCMVSVMRSVSTGRGRPYADIEAARQWLLAAEDCTGRVGVIGFCMGGGFALLLAGQGTYDVAAANYAQLPRDPDAALRGACAIVASYGGKDKVFRGGAAKLEAALSRAGVEHDVKLYPDAGHSFLNETDNAPPALRPVLRTILGIGPEPAAAADAWQRIETFFARHLTADAPTESEADATTQAPPPTTTKPPTEAGSKSPGAAANEAPPTG